VTVPLKNSDGRITRGTQLGLFSHSLAIGGFFVRAIPCSRLFSFCSTICYPAGGERHESRRPLTPHFGADDTESRGPVRQRITSSVEIRNDLNADHAGNWLTDCASRSFGQIGFVSRVLLYVCARELQEGRNEISEHSDWRSRFCRRPGYSAGKTRRNGIMPPALPSAAAYFHEEGKAERA